jgi:hypothetical protein
MRCRSNYLTLIIDTMSQRFVWQPRKESSDKNIPRENIMSIQEPLRQDDGQDNKIETGAPGIESRAC